MPEIDRGEIIDDQGRVLMLRGVNLGGSSKVPCTPDGSTYRSEGFFDHRNISFVGRPFPLEEADEHYSRLRAWGFNTLRFLVTWEAIEHAGPGLHDQAYLDYLYAVVKKAGEHGFMVFIDPHQDVWSRFSGGDGAPGWTLEAAGLDMTKFATTGAAIVHQTHGDPFPRMIWPTNAGRFAAATMFTLFFAGSDFAPATRVEGHSIQEYLQSHFLRSMQAVARRLDGLDCVIGYDVFNEPQRGYVGVMDMREDLDSLKIGPMPTPWQATRLAAGFPERVPIFPLGVLGIPLKKHVLLNPERATAWLPGRTCVWRENAVWDYDNTGTPQLLRPAHFARVDGHKVDFTQDYLVPFSRRYAETIHSVAPRAMIFVENEVEDVSPIWPDAPVHRVVYAPHWYDGITLLTKRFFPFIGSDMRSRQPVFGKNNIRRSYARQLCTLKDEADKRMGGVPIVVGEIGIPFDLNKKQAFKNGNFSAQSRAMDRSLKAIEDNLLNCTLWDYTSDNINQRGDRWNDEDLSIFSRDQQSDPSELNSGGRALKSVVRPYPLATAGIPLRLSFDYQTGAFEYAFKDPENKKTTPTRLYIPLLHYPHGLTVQLSDGEFRYDPAQQLLEYSPGTLEIHIIKVNPVI